MLPVLLRFNGTVDVVTLPGGDTAILYRFPELQRRAALPALAAAPSALAGQSPNGFRKAVGKATSWLQELQNRGAELERQKGKEEFVAYAGVPLLPSITSSQPTHPLPATARESHRVDFNVFSTRSLSWLRHQ